MSSEGIKKKLYNTRLRHWEILCEIKFQNLTKKVRKLNRSVFTKNT